MALYQCIACGGGLEEYRNGLLRCPFCGSIQTIEHVGVQRQHANDQLSAVAIENIYKSAVEAMVKQKYGDAIQLFSNIRSYLDADAKLKQCQKMMLERKNAEIYNSACIALSTAKTYENYKVAARIFNQVLGYKDAAALMSKCLSTADSLRNEELYKKACELMREDNLHFLQQAADIFGSIITVKDSKDKQKECLDLIEKQQDEIEKKSLELKRKKIQSAKKKKIIFFTIAVSVIVWIVGVVMVRKITHSANGIGIKIVDTRAAQDNRYYYVYIDYKITNNTGKTIDYIEVVTYVADQNGKSIGIITSQFGSSYGSNALHLVAGKSVVQETYLSEYRSDHMDSLFVSLYDKNVEELNITYVITNVKWSDGYSYENNALCKIAYLK